MGLPYPETQTGSWSAGCTSLITSNQHRSWLLLLCACILVRAPSLRAQARTRQAEGLILPKQYRRKQTHHCKSQNHLKAEIVITGKIWLGRRSMPLSHGKCAYLLRTPGWYPINKHWHWTTEPPASHQLRSLQIQLGSSIATHGKRMEIHRAAVGNRDEQHCLLFIK